MMEYGYNEYNEMMSIMFWPLSFEMFLHLIVFIVKWHLLEFPSSL